MKTDELRRLSPRRTRRGVRIARSVGWVSLVAGLLVLGFVGQQLFVTSWLAERNQSALADERDEYFAAAEVTEVAYVPSVAPGEPDGPEEPVEPVAPEPILLVEEAPDPGQPFAAIRIPTIDRLVEGWTVVEGVSRRNLKNGAGHMPNTPLPGQPGNAVISGHRTTYGAPFHELDTLEPGHVIEVDTAVGTHVYEVRESVIVSPFDLWVTEPREGSWLTLTTCNPKFSARQRLVIFAEMVDGPNAHVFLS